MTNEIHTSKYNKTTMERTNNEIHKETRGEINTTQITKADTT